MGLILTTVLALVLAGFNGYAMPIQMEEENLVATAIAEDGTTYSLDTAEFQLLGREPDGTFLIFADQQFLKVTRSDLKRVIDTVGLPGVSALPAETDYETLVRNSRGDAVVNLQVALMAQGFLTGNPDGNYGSGTQRAVSNYQRDHGLRETGEADARLQMLILSAAEELLPVSKYADPKERFAVISEKTDANLEKVIEKNLGFEYDDISGVGLISDGSVITYSVPAETDIDQCDVTARFGMRVKPGEGGKVRVTPVLALTTTGTRRAIMQEVILKSGDARVSLPVANAENALDGVKSVETAEIPLDDAAVDLLAGVAEAKELKLRLTCKYGTYDIVVPAENLTSIADIGEAAQGLNS
jgi:hypothetical protein